MNPGSKNKDQAQASRQNQPDIGCVELACIIVNRGSAGRVHHISHSFGIPGETVLIGKGTIKNSMLKLLDLNDIRKEIVLVLAVKAKIRPALEKITQVLQLHKPNHGIAFCMPVAQFIGTRTCLSEPDNDLTGGEIKVYQSIFVIVDKGKAEMAVEAATRAGSRGGTIINARGSGIHETSRLFSMEIEPEKEIVLILSEKEIADQIAAAIRKDLKIDEPGNGVIFIMDVNQTYGLF